MLSGSQMQNHLKDLSELKEIENFLLKLFYLSPKQAYSIAYSEIANVIANNAGSMLKKFL